MLNADKITDKSLVAYANSVPAQVSGGASGIHLQDNRAKSVTQKKQVQALVNKGEEQSVQLKKNTTGLPDKLKSGVESLSGIDVSDVKVHYNSAKPAQLNAYAYAQGTDIHLAQGQEKHLPHEAWHVVQQKQGRVKPTIQLKDKASINDDGAKPVQRLVRINNVVYNNEQGYQNLLGLITLSKIKLSEKQKALLREWVLARGGISILGVRLSSGLEKDYPDVEELVAALKGDLSSRVNLRKETDLAQKVPEITGLKTSLNSVTKKIFAYIKQELANKGSALNKGGKKTGGEFWKTASSSYRGLWNFIGTPYNLNFYSKLTHASIMSLAGIPKPIPAWPLDSFKSTMSSPKGNIEEIFASVKQVSNVYNDRMGKRKFKTPVLRQDSSGKINVGKGYEESGEKRYNTQSLKEKELWTMYARQKNIPISAGASGSMDRIYKMATDAGATDRELIALALSGHHIFNQKYTMFSNDPHTFHEIMDTLRPYLKGQDDFTRSIKKGTYFEHLATFKKDDVDLSPQEDQ